MQKDPRTHKIIGAAMKVHNQMGPGHLEAVYQECLEIEFELQSMLFISNPTLSLYYKTRKLNKFYVPDFIVLGDIVVEIKAQKMLSNDDESQIINSLKSSHHEIGLLINFGEPSLKFKRFIYTI